MTGPSFLATLATIIGVVTAAIILAGFGASIWANLRRHRDEWEG